MSDIAWDGRFADGTRAPDGEYLATLTARDQAGNESKQTGVITVENNLFTLFLPPFNPPTESPLPLGESESEIPVTSFGGEGNNDGAIPVTGFFSAGGLTMVAGASGTVSFASAASANPNASSSTDLPESNILWGAAAAAAIGAFSAEILRKRQEEAAARALAAENAGGKKGKKEKPKLTYKQIGQAYQASINNFKASLIKQGLSTDQANALKTQAIKDGKIPSVASAIAQTVNAAVGGKGKVVAAPAAIPPVMPPGLSPEAQQAFLHGGSAAQGWINTNSTQLQEQHTLDLARQEAQARVEKQSATQAQGAPKGISPEAQAAFLHSGAAAAWVDANKEELQEQYTQELEAVNYVPYAVPAPHPSMEQVSLQPFQPLTFLSELLTYLKEETVALLSLQDLADPLEELKEATPGTVESVLSDEKLIPLLKKIEGLPAVQLVLPMLRGFGLDHIPGPLIKTLSTDAGVRMLGRLLASYEAGPLALIGMGLTVYPNAAENVNAGAPIPKTTADAAIDLLGGLATEVVSVLISSPMLFLGPLAPFAYGTARLASEGYLSLIWDSAANRYGWRTGLEELITPEPRPDPIVHPPAVVAPQVTVNIPVTATTTPQPFTPPAQATSEPEFPSVPTQTPEILPTQTPAPPGN